MNTRLDNVISAILDSYDVHGGINHLDGTNLPSRESVTAIVDELESVMFPGYRGEANLDRLNVRYVLGEKVTRIAKNLIMETQKSLEFKHRTEGRDDLESAARDEAEGKVLAILERLPGFRHELQMDVEAAFSGDPAAKSTEEIILSYPGLEAVMMYRIAHEFWVADIPLLPRMMSEYIHGRTGIDIHPGAAIGHSFFMDHGTGIVIGETTIIGDNVKIYHGVTLGARSVRKEEGNTKRHPTIEDDVTIYPGATILGGETVIGKGSVIGGNVWLLSSVPPYSRIYYTAENVFARDGSLETADFQI
jgi:serine O-acetyltransferase